MEESLTLRRASPHDAPLLCAIYNHYVLHSTATFETVPVSDEEMAQRIEQKLEQHDWLVGELEGTIVCYAYYGQFRPRPAYSRTAESTVYVSPQHSGRGFGTTIYSALIQSAASKQFRELIGVIALPNAASVKLHQSLRFSEAGVLRGVGHKFDAWIDIAIWQRSLHSGG